MAKYEQPSGDEARPTEPRLLNTDAEEPAAMPASIEPRNQNGSYSGNGHAQTPEPFSMVPVWEREARQASGVMREPEEQSIIGSRILSFIKKEWKWLLTSLPALLVAGGYLMLPASTAQVEKVRAGAASDLAIVKTAVEGQIQGVNIQINDLRSAQAETRADIKELLRRTPPFRTETASLPSPIAASAPPALHPAANPPHKHQVKKPQPKLTSGWSLFR